MATPAELVGSWSVCPFQADRQAFRDEHTTVSPRATAENVRSATQDLITDTLSSKIVTDAWSGETWRKIGEATRELGNNVTRSLVSGKPMAAPEMASVTDEEGKIVEEYASSCTRCHGSTKPVFFQPGEQCERSQMAHRALFNGVSMRLLVERLRSDPAAKEEPGA